MNPCTHIRRKQKSTVLRFLMLCLFVSVKLEVNAVEFKGVYITDAEQWFSLSTDSEIRWATIGSIFSGYTIVEYQEQSRRLKLMRGGEAIYVTMNETSGDEATGSRLPSAGSTIRLKRDVSANPASPSQIRQNSRDKDARSSDSQRPSNPPGSEYPRVAGDQQYGAGINQTNFSVRLEEAATSGDLDEKETNSGDGYVRKTPLIIKQPRPDQYVVY